MGQQVNVRCERQSTKYRIIPLFNVFIKKTLIENLEIEMIPR